MFSVSGQLELNGELIELDSDSDLISFNGSRSAVLQIFAVLSALVVANKVESGLNLHFKPYFLCALSFNFLCTGSICARERTGEQVNYKSVGELQAAYPHCISIICILQV